METFNAPSMIMEIGKHTVQMPIDWSILAVERELGICEMVPLTSLNDRGFEVLTINPLTHKMIQAQEVKIINVFQEVKWYFPKIKSGQMLAVPLQNGPKPMCAYFVKDISRQCEQVDYGSVW